jgi:hypothetical protein
LRVRVLRRLLPLKVAWVRTTGWKRRRSTLCTQRARRESSRLGALFIGLGVGDLAVESRWGSKARTR